MTPALKHALEVHLAHVRELNTASRRADNVREHVRTARRLNETTSDLLRSLGNAENNERIAKSMVLVTAGEVEKALNGEGVGLEVVVMP